MCIRQRIYSLQKKNKILDHYFDIKVEDFMSKLFLMHFGMLVYETNDATGQSIKQLIFV